MLLARDRSAGAYLLLAEIKGSQHRGKGEWPCLQVHFINGNRSAEQLWNEKGGGVARGSYRAEGGINNSE